MQLFQVTDNYYDTISLKRKVVIQSKSGELQIKTATFDDSSENWNALSADELINKVLEWDYRTHMQGKFMNEAVELAEKKAKEAEQLANQIKESAELIQSLTKAKADIDINMAKMNEAIAKSEQMNEKNNELIKTVTLTVNELIAELMNGDEDEATEEDTTA